MDAERHARVKTPFGRVADLPAERHGAYDVYGIGRILQALLERAAMCRKSMEDSG